MQMAQKLFTGGPAQPLVPQNPQISVFPHFCVNVPTSLVLKEKAFSFSGDDFSVKDQNGAPVVVCKGKAMSFRDRKVITDPTGKELCHLRSKTLALRKTFVAEDSQGRDLFKVVKKMAIGTKMEATFINATTGHEVVVTLKGDMWGGSAALTLGENGPAIAQISRSLANMREVFTDNQTYFCTVAPGVDLALMACIVICFDESKNEAN